MVDPQSITTGGQFAQGLSALRLHRGSSIRAVARATGIPSATLGGYFAGRHLPPATQPQILDSLLAELGVAEPELPAWREALARARRDGPARVTGRAATVPPCPYRGLEPFTDQDDALFFGREQVVAELVTAVTQLSGNTTDPRMLMVVGASGSGKSSTLRAGLVAQMRRRAGDPWTIAVIVPGADPDASLQEARNILAGAPRGLLVVDQAEEMFSPLVAETARRRFIRGLLELADPTNPADVVVVAALRADFYGQAAADADLLPILRTGQVLLGAMNLADLRRAVVSPADQVGVRVDPELVELLVRDLHPRGQAPGAPGYQPGALPLVSHALLAAWSRHEADRLTVADYVAAGGIDGAVQQTAEAAVGTLDERGMAAAQWLFGQLVVVDDDGAMTRRRVRPDELHHPDPATDLALDNVIEAFISGRLLTADDQTLEISHEALLSAWPRLREWVLCDLDSARLQRRIADAAQTWRELSRDPGALLRGSALADAQALAAHPLTSARVLGAPEQEFVAASTELATAERRTAQRHTRRLKALVAIMTALALLSGVLAFVSLNAVDDANTARDEALSRQLAITADELRSSDPALAAQLALAGFHQAPTVQARSSLLDSTAVATPTRFVGPAGDMHAVASPDGRILAVSGVAGVTRLWRAVQKAGRPGELARYVSAGEVTSGGGPIYASAFNPRGDMLAVAGQPGTVVVWDISDVSTPTRIAELDTDEATVYSLAFSADGSQLAAGTSQPAVRRWRLSPSGKPAELPAITEAFGGSVHAVAFDPRGGTLATGSEDGVVRTWTVPGDGPARLLGTGDTGDTANFIFSVAYSPDGRTLATGDKGRAVRLWDVTDPATPRRTKPELAGFGSWVNSVAFSPDGQTLAAGSSDGFVQTYRASDGTVISKLPGPGAFTSVQFVGSGDALLTSEVGGTARLWPNPGPTLAGFTDSVWNVVPAARGQLLLVAPGRQDGKVHLFDTTDQTDPRPLVQLAAPESAGPLDGAAWISPDGRWIAGGTATGRVVVWQRDPATGEVDRAQVAKLSDQLIEAVAISDDGKRLAALADDSVVGIWRLRPGASAKIEHKLAVAGLPLAVSFSPDGSLLAVGTTDRKVHLWQLTAQGVATELPSLLGFENYVYSVTFDPTGRYLAAGSTDRTVRIWDVTDPAHALPVGSELRGPQDTVGFLDWSATGDRLAAATAGGSVWLWDVSQPAHPEQLASLGAADGNLFTTAFSPDGLRLYAGGSDKSVHTWSVQLPDVLANTCVRTGSPMTAAEWDRLVPGVPFSPPCPS